MIFLLKSQDKHLISYAKNKNSWHNFFVNRQITKRIQLHYISNPEPEANPHFRRQHHYPSPCGCHLPAGSISPHLKEMAVTFEENPFPAFPVGVLSCQFPYESYTHTHIPCSASGLFPLFLAGEHSFRWSAGKQTWNPPSLALCSRILGWNFEGKTPPNSMFSSTFWVFFFHPPTSMCVILKHICRSYQYFFFLFFQFK